MRGTEGRASLISPTTPKPTPALMTAHARAMATMYAVPPSASAGRYSPHEKACTSDSLVLCISLRLGC
jgi:hypothetical protein